MARKRLWSSSSFRKVELGETGYVSETATQWRILRGDRAGQVISNAGRVTLTKGAHPKQLSAERKAGTLGYKSAASEQQARKQIKTRRLFKRPREGRWLHPEEIYGWHLFLNKAGVEQRALFNGRNLIYMQSYRDDVYGRHGKYGITTHQALCRLVTVLRLRSTIALRFTMWTEIAFGLKPMSESYAAGGIESRAERATRSSRTCFNQVKPKVWMRRRERVDYEENRRRRRFSEKRANGGGVMRLYAQCACGECHPAALRSDERCVNCRARERGRREIICPWCGLQAPFARHHVDGRKVSDRIVRVCRNCHAKYHSDERRRRSEARKPSVSRRGGAAEQHEEPRRERGDEVRHASQ